MTTRQNGPSPQMPGPRARCSPPLFLRIFALVLGALIGAQLINAVSILLVRAPQPAFNLLEDVAEALRLGGPGTRDLVVTIGDPPAAEAQDERDLQIRAWLAGQLGLAPEMLRASVSRPPDLFHLKDKDDGDKEIQGGSKPGEPDSTDPARRAEMIVGHFVAAIRLDDGRWRLVRPAGSWIEPWQWQSLLWLLGTLVVAAPLAWVIARRIAAPLGLFSAAAERLGRDPAMPPLPLADVPPEVAPAAAAFNDMQARLKRYVDDRTTMVAAIAHDLRTPLMRLNLLLESAPDDVRRPAEAEIREMAERIRAALAFMRDRNVATRRQRLDLRALLESIADDWADRGAVVRLAPGDSAVVNADVGGLRALFSNLVDNAVHHADGARIALYVEGAQAIVEVADDGPGIPEAELERVFEPFYRLEASRNRATGGTGLGLASARAVARAHGGDIRLANRPSGQGTVAIVSLPLDQ